MESFGTAAIFISSFISSEPYNSTGGLAAFLLKQITRIIITITDTPTPTPMNMPTLFVSTVSG